MTESLNVDGVHLDTIVLIALADFYAGVFVFGESKE